MPKNFAPITPLYLCKVFGIPKDFLQKVLCVGGVGRKPQLTFLIRKVDMRISYRLHRFTLAKLLKFQETFLEKFLVSGFGANSPNIQYVQKSTAVPCFLNCQIMLELSFQTSTLRGFFKKPLKNPQNFRTDIPIYLG